MEIKIREIIEEDRKCYIEFCDEFYNMPTVLHSVSIKNFINTFDMILQDKTYAEAFIVLYKNEKIGYILISKTYSQEVASMVLLIEEIFILEKYRSMGIGQNIFEFLKNRYKKYNRFRLEVVKNNEKAIKLYEKIGFSFLDYMQMVME